MAPTSCSAVTTLTWPIAMHRCYGCSPGLWEVRPPFLDHRIVEFAATLPENFKIRGSSLKFILGDLMRDKLPPAVLARSKEGFDIPAHHWLRTSLKPVLTETLNEQAVRQSGV